MTQEQKQILLVDLCARLPYGIKCYEAGVEYTFDVIGTTNDNKEFVFSDGYERNLENIKPYLRPMSSMSEEELKEFRACHCVYELHPDFQPMMCNLANELNMFDWLNSHHFDYRGLIKKGLALEADDDMYIK